MALGLNYGLFMQQEDQVRTPFYLMADILSVIRGNRRGYYY